MKFQIRNKQLIRNEIIVCGGNYPPFYASNRKDGFVFCSAHEGDMVTLLEKLYEGEDENYQYEAWNCNSLNGESRAYFIKTMGFESKNEELCYVEEHSEI